jgi:hypothetical protein
MNLMEFMICVAVINSIFLQLVSKLMTQKSNVISSCFRQQKTNKQPVVIVDEELLDLTGSNKFLERSDL